MFCDQHSIAILVNRLTEPPRIIHENSCHWSEHDAPLAGSRSAFLSRAGARRRPDALAGVLVGRPEQALLLDLIPLQNALMSVFCAPLEKQSCRPIWVGMRVIPGNCLATMQRVLWMPIPRVPKRLPKRGDIDAIDLLKWNHEDKINCLPL